MRTLLLISALCITSAVHALDDSIDCENAISTPEINECAAAEQEEVEDQLNATYKRVMKFLSQPDADGVNYSEVKDKLLEAQRLWVKFREADCQAVYDLNASGTIRNVMWIGCMQSHAEQRIKELESFLQE